MIVGIAGKYCAGKNCVVSFLRELGFGEVDVDRIGHGVLETLKADVVARFGPDILTADGSIDRRKLGAIVFRDRAKRALLERTVHPEMVRQVEATLRQTSGDVAIHAAILFPMGLHRLCNLVVCVKAPAITRLLRALRRDRIGIFGALRRILAQRGICPKPARALVDIYYVWNIGARRHLRRRIVRILDKKGMNERPWKDRKSYS